jgi:FdrA protein
LVKQYHEIKGRYVDSVLLMQITRELEKSQTVSRAGMMVATKENLAIFENLGFEPPADIQSSSILIAVEAENDEEADKAIKHAIELVDAKVVETAAEKEYELEEIKSIIQSDDFPVLFISTPGQFVKDIALKGLEQGANLHIFSSNVPVETEVMLKNKGREKGLLVMGPDAGTSIINGKGLGFSNSVKTGEVAVVGSSGTGIQELTVLLDRGGLGISAAIGVGSNDFSKEVGAIVTKQAIERLKDAAMLIIIAKRPEPDLKKQIVQLISDKPSVFISLGDNRTYDEGKAFVTGYIDDGVNFALKNFGKEQITESSFDEKPDLGNRKLLRGYFVGGSLCYQAQAVLQGSGIQVYSNGPTDPKFLLPADWKNLNVCIDTGAEEYVKGKPHPMIDPKARNSMIVEESKRPDVAAILFDVMLGYGSSMDPLEGLGGVNDGPVLVASICGTEKDEQDFKKIRVSLEKLGVKVFDSAGQAAKFAAKLVGGLS